MRTIRTAIAALLVALGALAAAGALAQTATAGSDSVNELARSAGMARAPALIRQTGITCALSDARQLPAASGAGGAAGTRTFGATGEQSDGMTRMNSAASTAVGPSPLYDIQSAPQGGPDARYYELACRDGLGYLVNATAKKVYLCIELAPDAAATLPCLLPGNSPQATLATLSAALTRAAVTCDATRLRDVGHDSHSVLVEVACSGGDGYIVQLPNPMVSGPMVSGPMGSVAASGELAVHASNCLALSSDGGLACQLTDTAAQIVAAGALLRTAQPACRATAQRFVGVSTRGSRFFEFRCQDGEGFILSESQAGATTGVMQCSADAAAKLGGCKLQGGNAGG